MEKSDSDKIKVGLFVVTGLALFIMTVYLIGNKKYLFEDTVEISAVFNNVNGLQKGNNVRFSGITIGTVKEIEIVNDSVLKVNMSIEKKMLEHIKSNAIASINSDGLVGNMIVNIKPGNGKSSSILPGGILKSINKLRTEDILNTLSDTNNNIAILSNNLVKITENLNTGKGTIPLLLNDEDVAKNLKESLIHLKTTSQGTNVTINELNKLINSLNNKNNVISVINDTITANKIKHLINNLENSSSKIDLVISNLNTTITNAKDGKGAINYLSNNPELVQKIDSTITNINQSSIKLNENLEALKHNFLFKGYFKRKEKKK